MCNFHAPYFGASYPDACCIDGFLWDLDSCDEPGGGLRRGGDDPCPRCNHATWVERAKDHFEDLGYIARDAGKPREYAHKPVRFEETGDEAKFREYWLAGWDQRERESAAIIT